MKKDESKYKLILYVAGTTSRSVKAIERIRNVCEKSLKGRYDLEVVDLHKHPDLARNANIVATPALVKRLPAPIRQLVGDMAQEERVLVGLEIEPKQHKD